MSIFRSFSDAVQSCFNTITSTAGSAQKGLDIVNDYVDNCHKSMTRNFAKQAILDTASQHERIQIQLETNPKLAKLFADLEAEWGDKWETKPLMGKPPVATTPKNKRAK